MSKDISRKSEFELAADQQRRIAEIGRIVTASTDLNVVFTEFAEQAKNLVPFDRLAISNIDAEAQIISDAHIAGLETTESNYTGPYTLEDSALPAVVYENHQVSIADAKTLASHAKTDVTADNGLRIAAGLRSAMFTPIVLQGTLVGSLVFRSKQDNPYGEADADLAAQIAGVISTNQHIALLEQASAQHQRLVFEQSRIAEIGRIVSSTLDINEVLSRFAQEAKYLVPHDRLVISAWSEDGASLIEQYIEGIKLEGNVSGRVIEVPKDDVWQKLYVEQLPWVARGEDYAAFKQKNDLEQKRYESGLRSVLMVPLLWQGKNTGSIAFRSKNPNSFGEDEVKLAVEIAAQISGTVTTISQYRQIEEQSSERQRLADEQARIAEIGRVVSSSLDLDEVLSAFAEQARALVPFDRMVVSVVNEELTEVTDIFVNGVGVGHKNDGVRLPFPSATLLHDAISNQTEFVAVGDAYDEYIRTVNPKRKMAREILKSFLLVPLLWQGRPVGSLNLRSKDPHAFGDKQITIAKQIAAQIAGAIATSNQFRLLESALEDVRLQATALDAAEDAFIIRNADTSIAYVNPGFEKQTGFSREEILDPEFTYPEHVDIDPEVVDRVWRQLRSGESWRSIVPSTRKDGTEYIVDATLTPIFNAAGELDKFMGVRRDVTEQIKADELNKTLAAALESADEAMMILNADTSIEWVNEAFVRDTGYSREEAVGKSSPFLRSEQNAPELFEGVWEQVRTGQTWAGRIWTKRKDGSEYLCDSSLSPVFSEDGAIANYVGIRHDITAVIQAEQDREARRDLDAQNKQLLELNDQREEFFSTVSHELRTPLTSVMAFADILSRDRDNTLTDTQKDHLDVIKRNSRNLNELVEDMLDFSRMTNDHLKLEKSEFEFHSLLDSVVESMEPIAAERGQSLIIEPHTQPVWIVADHGRIVQIISNLINNSCKYSPTDTKITIIVQSASSQVSVTVSDHGVGIPPKDLESIYSPFFRSNQLKVREEIGTGLGLAISKSLVDLHDGTIEAKSVIDEGTDITVTLPGASDSPTVNAKA